MGPVSPEVGWSDQSIEDLRKAASVFAAPASPVEQVLSKDDRVESISVAAIGRSMAPEAPVLSLNPEQVQELRMYTEQVGKLMADYRQAAINAGPTSIQLESSNHNDFTPTV